MKNEVLVKSGTHEYRLDFTGDRKLEGEVNGKKISLDILPTGTGFHVLENNRAVKADIISVDMESKTVELKIDHKYYRFEVKDKYDMLLEQLGMDQTASGKVSEIKAPMPGLVLDVLAGPGESIQADQPILILEAMKMENVIKSPGDSVVKKVSVKKGDSVEKNQVLIEFE